MVRAFRFRAAGVYTADTRHVGSGDGGLRRGARKGVERKVR